MIPAIFLTGCLIFWLAFRYYGRFLDKRLDVSDARVTPAHTQRDGVDYVPTHPAVLFGHHFSSIAGAGPIVGPIIAALAFGWFPAALWIILGSVFIGGVHDFTSLIASLRHGGRSIGDLCRSMISPTTRKLFLLFILLTLVYVIIVFIDLTAASYAPRLPVSLAAPVAAEQVHNGGVVATASLLFIALAFGFGWTLQKTKLGLVRGSMLFVPLVFLSVWLATIIPLTADRIPPFLGEARNTWLLILLLYCMLASVLPVWILLQPRDYLSSFLLYACIAGGSIGLLLSGLLGRVPAVSPGFTGWRDAQLGLIFPALFITIACGAVSGFHSIVASGTTAKQLDRERSARKIGYGGMLVEGILALLAVSTVMAMKVRTSDNPVVVFANGLGMFLEILGIPPALSIPFGLLAVSTFLLTTLDTCTRLSRYLLQELFQWDNSLRHRLWGTLLVLGIPVLVVFREIPDPSGAMLPAWKAIWPAFGATNQLLAALALTVVYAWLRGSGRKAIYVALPAVFMCGTTLTALVQLAARHLGQNGSLFIGSTCLGLCLLAILVLSNLLLTLHRTWNTPPPPAET
jgi:carbon starvation protein